MKILALDIATQMGIAVADGDGVPEAWSVDLGKGMSEDHRFSKVLSTTAKLLHDYEPDMVAIEAPIGGPKTSHYLVGLAACVRGCVANRKLPLMNCQIARVRKNFIDRHLRTSDFPGLSKSAAKREIKATVVKYCQLRGWDITDHDAADAAATLDYARGQMGMRTMPVGLFS